MWQQQNDCGLVDKVTRAFVSSIHSGQTRMFRSTSSQRYLIYVAPRFDYISIRLIASYRVLFILLTCVIPDLDFGRLAVGFGLLTLPKMPELPMGHMTGAERLVLMAVEENKCLLSPNSTRDAPIGNRSKFNSFYARGFLMFLFGARLLRFVFVFK